MTVMCLALAFGALVAMREKLSTYLPSRSIVHGERTTQAVALAVTIVAALQANSFIFLTLTAIGQASGMPLRAPAQ